MKKLHKFIIDGVLKELYFYPSEFNSQFRKLYPGHKHKTQKEINLIIENGN
jgi:hypothetical protein